MKFLYPEFLYGLLALAIPIIIHLFNFRKSKVIYFSNTDFLKNVKKSTSQKRKLKHYLILASRLLFIFFLVLAFAQPFIPSEDKNPKARQVYIYLDNSSSMTNKPEENLTAFEQGISYISSIADLYTTNTEYRLLTNDFAPFSNTLKSKNELEDLITEMSVSNVYRTFEESYSRLTQKAPGSDDSARDIYIISDFQKSTIGQLENLNLDTTDQIFLTPVQYEQTKNIFIDSVYLSNPFLVEGEKNQLNVILVNSGNETVEGLPLKLFINDIQSANANIDLQPGQKTETSFEIAYGLQGVNKCRLTFEEYPVTFDNDFYFILKLENKINILEIKQHADITPVETVFGNQTLFSFSSREISNVDYNLMFSNDLVVLTMLDNIDNSLLQALENYLDQNGNLMLIPSANPDISSYTPLLSVISKYPAPAVKEALAMPDLTNPFFENIFETTNEQFQMPEVRNNITWTGSTADLLRLRNGQPYLSSFRRGGTILVLGSPLSEPFTNFHQHAMFVPVMYRIAAMSKTSYDNLYYTINDPAIILKPDSLNKQDIFRLKSIDNEFIPGQRIQSSELVLDLPKHIISPGFYDLMLKEQKKGVLAFNREKKESYLEQYSLEEINELFSIYKNVTIFDVKESDDFKKEIKKKKFGVPLWKYAIILALFFLLTEILLIRFL